MGLEVVGYRVGVVKAWLGNWNCVSHILGVIDKAFLISSYQFQFLFNLMWVCLELGFLEDGALAGSCFKA